MDQEKIAYITNVENQARQFEENLQLIDNQINELGEFIKNLNFIIKSKEKDMLSSLGRRVYLKAKIEDKEKLFVDIGAGVVLKKTPEETLTIVREQITRLQDVRVQIASQLESYYEELENFIRNVKNHQ
ncbi:MAG: prefoldin subunit alpha [Nanoarchaeota archaeon]